MAKASRELVALRTAEKAARKNIRVLRDGPLNSNLEAFCFSLADAYRQGLEEGQGAILSRIQDLITRQQRLDDTTPATAREWLRPYAKHMNNESTDVTGSP